jgi:hypothetical protein
MSFGFKELNDFRISHKFFATISVWQIKNALREQQDSFSNVCIRFKKYGRHNAHPSRTSGGV